MTPEAKDRPATLEEIERLERKIIALLNLAGVIAAVIVAVLTWYLTDLKDDLRDDIRSSRNSMFALADRIRAESMERHNELREDMGKERIEYDPLPPPAE